MTKKYCDKSFEGRGLKIKVTTSLGRSFQSLQFVERVCNAACVQWTESVILPAVFSEQNLWYYLLCSLNTESLWYCLLYSVNKECNTACLCSMNTVCDTACCVRWTLKVCDTACCIWWTQSVILPAVFRPAEERTDVGLQCSLVWLWRWSCRAVFTLQGYERFASEVAGLLSGASRPRLRHCDDCLRTASVVYIYLYEFYPSKFYCSRARELCESRCGHPGLPSLISWRFLWTEQHFSNIIYYSRDACVFEYCLARIQRPPVTF